MKEQPTQSRAYVCKVLNRKARTSASSEYFQVFIEDNDPLLFTSTELANAAKRAAKNPEDIVPITFVDICDKECEQLSKPGILKRLLGIFKS